MLDALGELARTLHKPGAQDLGISSEGLQIRESLKNKDVSVRIFAVTHVGEPPDGLIRAFGASDLRTSEDMWGSVGEYLDPRKPSPVNSVQQMLIGLGPNPLYPEDLIQQHRTATVTVTGNAYFEPFDRAYNDIRGVDQSTYAGNWTLAIAAGAIHTNPLDFGKLPDTTQQRLTDEVAIHLLLAKRDQIQALFIARILALYTHDKKGASLNHIGGANHLALPVFLKHGYGIPVEVDTVGTGPDPFNKRLFDLIPPADALKFLRGDVTEHGFSVDGNAVVRRLAPHVRGLIELLRQQSA